MFFRIFLTFQMQRFLCFSTTNHHQQKNKEEIETPFQQENLAKRGRRKKREVHQCLTSEQTSTATGNGYVMPKKNICTRFCFLFFCRSYLAPFKVVFSFLLYFSYIFNTNIHTYILICWSICNHSPRILVLVSVSFCLNIDVKCLKQNK